MEPDEILITDRGTVKLTSSSVIGDRGHLECNGVDLGECKDIAVTYTREEMLFRDST